MAFGISFLIYIVMYYVDGLLGLNFELRIHKSTLLRVHIVVQTVLHTFAAKTNWLNLV